MVTLSYSTISQCLQPQNSHNYMNKLMDIKIPDNDFFIKGREVEKTISDHVSGKKLNDNLSHIPHKFSIVQEQDFDPRCKRFVPIDNNYQLFALLDGHEPKDKRFLEIKSANSKMWSIGKWMDSYQRKLYAYAYPEYTSSIIITALMDQNRWKMEQPKVYEIPSSKQDIIDAEKYITNAIKTIEARDFTGGLVDGRCIDKYCYYGKNCYYKQ